MGKSRQRQPALGMSSQNYEILCQLSGLSPPSPPPKSVTHQSPAYAGDFTQFPIHLKKTLPQKTEGSQTVDKKLFSPEGGRIALSANERIAEFLDFAIQAKFAYVNKNKKG